MSAALGLRRLQQIDTEIDRVQQSLEAIAAALGDGVLLKRVAEGVEQGRHRRDAIEGKLRQAEATVTAQQLKIQQAESNLYGNQSHTPKELQELQEDVGSLKRYLVTLEERELEVMAEMETAESELRTAEGELDVVRATSGREHEHLHAESEALGKEMERLQAERQATFGAVSGEHMAAYEQLRATKRGLAVAEIHDDGCAACGTTLTAAMQQLARAATAIVHCPTCGRILYAP
jgi:hypothetical protein